ncbi:hypothetical protein BKA62DRAFT_500257 [Auriculariales sp. MPI-PUGE-AT-0066]|nr:hypothetical protein BKA62DRAFT_500257 [Auriculariales sp. MPI-PUGE-AT-0066]
MIRTSATTHHNAGSKRGSYFSTSSIILAAYTKSKATVELTTATSSGEAAVPLEKTLRHQRTFRPADFGHDNDASPLRVEVVPPATPPPTRDLPPFPTSPPAKRFSPNQPLPDCAQSPSSPPVERISRSLRREKTLMPEDFTIARRVASNVTSPPDVSSSRTQPDVPQSSGRPRRGFAQITLGPSAGDKKRYTRTATDMRHYTVWQEFAEFDGSHRQLAISTDTAPDNVFQIQGMLLFSAFDDRARNSEHPDLVYTVADIIIELQSYSHNACAYAKETADAPEYVDLSDASGTRRKADTHIRISFDANDKKWRSVPGRGHGHSAPMSCSFGIGIPMHLFRRAKERYFRVIAHVELEIMPRHPLSYNSGTSGSGACKHATVQLACAASDPVDFTVSHLVLPRCDSSP